MCVSKTTVYCLLSSSSPHFSFSEFHAAMRARRSTLLSRCSSSASLPLPSTDGDLDLLLPLGDSSLSRLLPLLPLACLRRFSPAIFSLFLMSRVSGLACMKLLQAADTHSNDGERDMVSSRPDVMCVDRLLLPHVRESATGQMNCPPLRVCVLLCAVMCVTKSHLAHRIHA